MKRENKIKYTINDLDKCVDRLQVGLGLGQ